jgi:hypothetical protein
MKLITTFPLEHSDISAVDLQASPPASEARPKLPPLFGEKRVGIEEHGIIPYISQEGE